jgi:hypothetical protein
MSYPRLACALGLIGLLMPVSTVRAEEQPCVGDVKKLCATTPPGGGEMIRCLESHEAELSPGCRRRLATLKRDTGRLAVACRNDIGKVCKGVSPGGGRLATCLREHESDLSVECKESLRRRAAAQAGGPPPQ